MHYHMSTPLFEIMHDNTTNNDLIDNELILTAVTNIDETLQLNSNVADEHDYTLDDDNLTSHRLGLSLQSTDNDAAPLHHPYQSRYDDDLVHTTISHIDDPLHQPDINCGVVVNENEFADPTTTPNENDEYSASSKILDGEKMLEVTRKLFRSTERDPDRDLRKQVLLKTALRNLPHFVHYQQYSEINQHHQYNNNNINDINLMQQYNNHLQPNAIEVSTTSMRMLDLNDDYDQRDDLERVADKRHLHNQSSTTLHSHLDDADENDNSDHLEQNTVNQFDDILFNRHNSFDNLYQPNELNESNDEAISQINWNNIGYKIFEFPSIDNVSKVSNLLDEELKEEQQQEPVEIDEESLSNEPTLDQQCSIVNESSPSSSCTDDSLVSYTSNSEVDDKEDSSKKIDSSNTIHNSFYPVSSSPRSCKRRSSRDYEDSMDIDLARASKLFEASPFGQFKRLRKNFDNQSAPLIETTTGGF